KSPPLSRRTKTRSPCGRPIPHRLVYCGRASSTQQGRTLLRRSCRRREGRKQSEERQVLVDLPLRHLTMVGGPFMTFQFDEPVGDWTQRSLDHLVLAQLLNRF